MDELAVCRLCLRSGSQPMTFFPDLAYNMIPFLNVYFELVGMTLTEYPGFPEWICLSCKSEMILAYKFRQKCLKTERRLKKLHREQPKATNFEFIPTPKHPDSLKKESLKIEAVDNESEFIDIKLEDEVEVKLEIEDTELQDPTIETVKVEDLQSKKTGRRTPKKKDSNLPETKSKPRTPRIRGVPSKTIYKCEQCDKIYKTYNCYMLHKDRHNNVLRYACDQCHRKFSHWVKRRSHIYRVHLKKSYCECSHCGMGFDRKYALDNHISSVHMNVRAHQCETCGKTFKNKHTLNKHKLIHKNYESMKCETCGKILKNKKCLQQHSRVHTDEKNYICPVCSQAFTWNATLKTHVRKCHPDKVHLLPPDGTIVNKAFLEKIAENHK